MWNTGKVLSKHLLKEVNDHEVFMEYYEIYKRQGHVSISMNTFFKSCRELVHNSEFIAQLIPDVIHEQFSVENSVSVSSDQYIIDVHGFKISAHEFIMREFCIIACDASLLFHCLVKLPCDITEVGVGYQKQVQWLTQNFHGLHWDITNGYSVSHLRRIIFQLCSSKPTFFCKGLEKVQWIKKLFHLEIVNHISEKEYPALKTLNLNTGISKCTYHDPVEVNACALRNCFQLQHWMKHEKPQNLVNTLLTVQL